MSSFDRNMHIGYFKRCLKMLPSPYSSQEINRLTFAFFCISGLDVLNGLNLSNEERKEIIDWIYSLQVVPDADYLGKDKGTYGFRGSNWIGVPYNDTMKKSHYPHDCAHIAMTFCALLLLLILGDDFSRVNRKAIVESLKELQLDDGSYKSTLEGGESDMRFVYCACVISHLLDDWSGVDRAMVLSYIKNSMTELEHPWIMVYIIGQCGGGDRGKDSNVLEENYMEGLSRKLTNMMWSVLIPQSYDCAFGQGPGLESHGGSTFCAVASLSLLGATDTIIAPEELEQLRYWLISRQQTGFQGRPNKPTDSCYSFWVGATLDLLKSYDWVDKEANSGFLRTCQFEKYGGFGKWPDTYPDVLHTYFSVCGFSLMGCEGLKKLNCPMNISDDSYQNLKNCVGSQE